MLYVSVTLLLYAMLTGLFMIVSLFKGTKPWMPLVLGHGILAAMGLVLALLVALSTGTTGVRFGVAILCLAALGGSVFLGLHLRGRPYPWRVVLLHALPAGCGVGWLVFALIR